LAFGVHDDLKYILFILEIIIIKIIIIITDDKGLWQELTSPEQIMYS